MEPYLKYTTNEAPNQVFISVSDPLRGELPNKLLRHT